MNKNTTAARLLRQGAKEVSWGLVATEKIVTSAYMGWYSILFPLPQELSPEVHSGYQIISVPKGELWVSNPTDSGNHGVARASRKSWDHAVGGLSISKWHWSGNGRDCWGCRNQGRGSSFRAGCYDHCNMIPLLGPWAWANVWLSPFLHPPGSSGWKHWQERLLAVTREGTDAQEDAGGPVGGTLGLHTMPHQGSYSPTK